MPIQKAETRLKNWEIEFLKYRRLGWKIPQIIEKGNLNVDSGNPLTLKEANSFSKTKRYKNALTRSFDDAVVDITRTLSHLSNKALEVLEAALNSDEESIRISAAKDILDRSGIKSVDVKKRLVLNLTAKEYKELAGTFNEIRNYKEKLGEDLNSNIVNVIPVTSKEEKGKQSDEK